MTNADIRRENARQLASDCGGMAAFGEKLDMTPSQVSQLIGKNPSKNIGNSIARRIEDAFNKERGWLDLHHAAPDQEAVSAAAELFEKVSHGYVRADELTTLIDLFSKSTPNGRKFILRSAANAEKLAAPIRIASED